MSDIYEFFYPDRNIKQKKILIPHEEYLKLKVLPDDSEEEEERKEGLLTKLTGGMEWFTDKSPLFDAINTGTINCNGTHPVKITRL
jgi:hypothetical protein